MYGTHDVRREPAAAHMPLQPTSGGLGWGMFWHELASGINNEPSWYALSFFPNTERDN